MQADLVQLVQRLEPCSLGATAGTPARDGGSVLTCTYKGGHAQHTTNKEQPGGAHREAVCGHPTWRGRAAASWKRAHRAVSLKREWNLVSAGFFWWPCIVWLGRARVVGVGVSDVACQQSIYACEKAGLRACRAVARVCGVDHVSTRSATHHMQRQWCDACV